MWRTKEIISSPISAARRSALSEELLMIRRSFHRHQYPFGSLTFWARRAYVTLSNTPLSLKRPRGPCATITARGSLVSVFANSGQLDRQQATHASLSSRSINRQTGVDGQFKVVVLSWKRPYVEHVSNVAVICRRLFRSMPRNANFNCRLTDSSVRRFRMDLQRGATGSRGGFGRG